MKRQATGQKLKLGVVGLGMGQAHAQGYQSHAAAEVVALCDVDQTKLAGTAERLGVLRPQASTAERSPPRSA